MATTFVGIKKEDKDELGKAAKLYAATGKDLSGVVGSIPEIPVDPKEAAEARKKAEEAKAEEDNEKAEKSLKLQAEAQQRKEDADQAGRRIAQYSDEQGNITLPEGMEADDLQPGNPGGGQPAPATERAKAAGRGRPEVTAPPTRS